MSEPLAVYLHDHLAGSHFAVHLLNTLREQHQGESLGSFFQQLLTEFQQDQETLDAIIARIGHAGPDLKDVASWVAEKASEWKLKRDRAGDLGVFEALEALALGVTGKLGLWRAMPVLAEMDTRLRAWDFEELADRARDQYGRIESRRLDAARTAFALDAQ